MSLQLGVVMDPIANIAFKKDSTLALLLEAQHRGWTLHYMEPGDLYLSDGVARARYRPLSVYDDPDHWYDAGEAQEVALAELDVILMRQDPPFDMEYIYATYLLEQAERAGTLVVNRPQSLRDCNEKLFANQFPECCPPTLVSKDRARLKAFLRTQQDVIFKPLDGMGGASIFHLHDGDRNATVVIDTLSREGRAFVMAQSYLPAIHETGDKRILMVEGEAVPYALTRIPAAGESRGNLAAGGRGEGVTLTERERWIAERVGPSLKARGLMFVGLDVIGDYLTEINVTSPTCVREIDAAFGVNVAAGLMDAIAARLGAHGAQG